jgi:hypothetical protein
VLSAGVNKKNDLGPVPHPRLAEKLVLIEEFDAVARLDLMPVAQRIRTPSLFIATEHSP